eukprot:gene4018-4268_t
MPGLGTGLQTEGANGHGNAVKGVKWAHDAADTSTLGRGLSMFGSVKSSDLMSRLKKAMSPEELQAAFQRREAALTVAKAQAARDWTPEYIPPTLIPTLQQQAKGQLLRKAAQVSSAMILSAGLAELIDAGMNVARFNFSHGDHEGHGAVLERLRKVAADKGKILAYALDTKGPEIRTAMLKDGKDIMLTAGQEVEVTEILDDKRLLGRVMNDHKLGQRKNCNLPGVLVDLPVLGPKDVEDVQQFAAKHKMDYIFASFVQSADDVIFIRKVLQEADAPDIKIICKIESQAGLANFDDILAVADGIMVARGDLAMEIPPEKVALAQKMMINKCQVSGKLVICATQMMESMIDLPSPSRAEETDVANAVFDGTAVRPQYSTLPGQPADPIALTKWGKAAKLISKYRPPCPIVAVSDDESVLRGLAGYYGIYPVKGLLLDGMKMLEVTGPEGNADISPVVTTENLDPFVGNTTHWRVSVSINKKLLVEHSPASFRAMKIIATLGPATWTPQAMKQLLLSGVDLVRFNVKHQTPAENQVLLDMWREAAAQVDDGKLKVKVTEVLTPTSVKGEALNNHTLQEMQLVQIKHAYRHQPTVLSARDREDIRFAALNQVDYLSVPFVRTPQDVLEGGPLVKIVAQIDAPAAIRNYDEILKVADAIMVSRTNLGMMIAPEKVPLAQKWLVQKARLASRPVMVAGQLMEGMAVSPRPSRPEITDVVNAVYDGADAVVLMQETSRGQFASACVETVAQIITDAEGGLDYASNYAFINRFTPKPLPTIEAGDADSDQLVLLSGPDNAPFLDVELFNSAQVGLDLITAPVQSPRKTKIICTLGPSCWSEAGLAELIDAGMNVARFNFSHGDHKGHLEVLQRLRKVIEEKKADHVACLLDTKGPEIRTAMLKDGKNLELKADQEVEVVAVGADYVTWEGYLDEATGRAVIGLSYDKLCRDVKAGGRILLADGSITIKVKEIIDDKRLLGVCMNSKSLGQRKNCNLPGVLVDLPVLGPKDVEDVQQFAAKHKMDFIAASFVQNADDVRFIRKVLDEAGGQHIQIISKIESWHGVINFDDILAVTDGIMVARGDLAMEVPSEKVALAQKMMTSKANVAGKFVITATQAFHYIHEFTDKPMSTRQAVLANVSKNVVDTDAGAATGLIPATEVPMIRYKVAPGGTGETTSSKSLANTGKVTSMAALASAFGASKQQQQQPMIALPEKKQKAYWEKTTSLRTTAIALDDILQTEESTPRKTKIICTLGPSCWSEAGLAELIDAGMNVARFNFSHGDHKGHLEVLQRLRKVAEAKGANIAYLLDTKGPEIRTAMLREGKNLELKKDQEVLLVAVGHEYKTWEGGLNPQTGVAELGISYEKLATSVSPGNIIKVADGSLSIEVTQVLDKKRVMGIVGQNKNVNLPGVHVDLPVLTSKDIDDLVNFAVRYKMDFVAASFVQSGDDVRFIRFVLDRSGGGNIKIISKIENEAGLENYDGILSVTDGIMAARGDLAMEVPSEKVALAQKMMITKANIAGKFVITATQMLESMTSNPLPTRAEMTDVANAVFDGTDAVMLSGETAGGAWPTLAVATMASIVTNAEIANSYYSTCAFMIEWMLYLSLHQYYKNDGTGIPAAEALCSKPIKSNWSMRHKVIKLWVSKRLSQDHTTKPFSRLEAMACAVCQSVTDANAQLVVVISATGESPRLISKYRPFVPQVVVTADSEVCRESTIHFGQYGMLVPLLSDATELALHAMDWAAEKGLWNGLGGVLVVSGHYEANSDMMPRLQVFEVAAQSATAVEAEKHLREEVGELRVMSVGLDASEESLREFSEKLERRVSSSGPRTPLRRQFSKAT